jgi:hypothetical protein
VHFRAIVVFGAVRAVVVQTDGLEPVALFQPASVMLETEFGGVIHCEIRTLAIQPLDGKIQSANCLNLRLMIENLPR